jgi:NAD+ kinase
MDKIKKVGIVIKPHAPDITRIIKELIEWLKKRHVKCILEKPAAEKIGEKNFVLREKIADKVDLIIVLGGDGTFLSIAHLAAREKVPVLGVNLGSLGFLTEVPLAELYSTLESYFNGEKEIISSRKMLKAKVGAEIYYGLNDIVINKGALARIIQLHLTVDGDSLGILRADGLIISTPTGSTAYSLAAGGPILAPGIPAIILTPICPHTLSFRPMVLPIKSKIKVKLLTKGEEVYLTVDGQRGKALKPGDCVEVEEAEFLLSLISSPKRNYFQLLQEKLGWGESTLLRKN